MVINGGFGPTAAQNTEFVDISTGVVPSCNHVQDVTTLGKRKRHLPSGITTGEVSLVIYVWAVFCLTLPLMGL